MNGYSFTLCGASLVALGSGALLWPAHRLFCVSDLHLGKSERLARRGGSPLPPYEIRDTLLRLEADLTTHAPELVVCLGDSFDDSAAAHALNDDAARWIQRLQTGRRWIWITGNHDPEPTGPGGEHLCDLRQDRLTFRHIAIPGTQGEISGHYHPKASLQGRARPAFLLDSQRLIMPAYGTYTGGLRSQDAALTGLMEPHALAILTGPAPRVIPMPR